MKSSCRAGRNLSSQRGPHQKTRRVDTTATQAALLVHSGKMLLTEIYTVYFILNFKLLFLFLFVIHAHKLSTSSTRFLKRRQKYNPLCPIYLLPRTTTFFLFHWLCLLKTCLYYYFISPNTFYFPLSEIFLALFGLFFHTLVIHPTVNSLPSV